MSVLIGGVMYASGQEYRLNGEGITWTGINATRTVPESIRLSFKGKTQTRERTHAWIVMSPEEATAVARALLSAVQGDGRQITIDF